MKKIFLLLTLLLPSTAVAQEYTPKGEVFGSIGGGITYDDEGGRGKGIDVGGGFGIRLTPKFGFETSVNRIHHLREFSSSGVRFEGTAVFATANLLYHFSQDRVQPYVIGGLGLIRYEGRSRFPGTPPRPAITGNGFAYNFGAGFRAFVNRHLSLRPEFRLFIGNPGRRAGVEPLFKVYRGSISVGYHW